uniref:Ovule protein n=2 Tax=Schistosoma mansoni TaxID=6183 RepID=A0A3Q0KV90_SCHMA
MLNESNHDQKPDSLLVDADFSNDPLFSNETLNQFEENISEKSNSDIISGVSGPHNQFISNDIPNKCEKYVPNESNSSHICDVIVPDVAYSHEQCVSSRISSQWYDESDGKAKFPEATREPVCTDRESKSSPRLS